MRGGEKLEGQKCPTCVEEMGEQEVVLWSLGLRQRTDRLGGQTAGDEMGGHHPQEGFCMRKLPLSNDKVTNVCGCLQRTAKAEQVFGWFHSQKSPEIVMQMILPVPRVL